MTDDITLDVTQGQNVGSFRILQYVRIRLFINTKLTTQEWTVYGISYALFMQLAGAVYCNNNFMEI
jgi:hypothetical protein